MTVFMKHILRSILRPDNVGEKNKSNNNEMNQGNSHNFNVYLFSCFSSYLESVNIEVRVFS